MHKIVSVGLTEVQATQEAQLGQDPTLKSFAQKTLPTLQQHLQLAQALTTRH